ncbi:protein MODIFIER OF SNC1 1-like isoform X1 [Zingiber officinale]|uniref:protein MODIFIER OF SNC1 1-like isoform X1 n=1 Tax=Zingiber officinale TaxID=94328 RepID=UPI001C4C0BBE|nr:protein MODIFIER OF SNC1 1-like isoform X1 [Zingiber officinale]XP_042441097.1 protein MODIFIER OF SNC1 1-like isoform X1 [Zingiber officinale]
MASNISSGDRRWASARKSGMTILGKVPKPINLPSQRSENNGLDPNVEIVPKGTLTWGSRPCSATSNVWGSSTLLSPKTDGGTGSPCHNSGRPSSGGSGTRPSTAGSDRSQDSNAWGSNSRPSTASGLLPSNQAPVLASRPRSAETRPIIAARPRSAETRPGSSQLSRFAENVADPAVAWGSPKTADKLGIASAINHEFSLTSGDFPTLGSEKRIDGQQAGHTLQEHSDASSGILRSNENLKSSSGDICKDQEDVSVPRTERNLSSGGAVSHNPELNNNLQQAQPHNSLNMTPSQFDSWHGSAMHSPDKIWYRGGALVGPYRPAGPPGSFPVDPFLCYPRPFPPNSEAALRPSAGPVQYHPTTGEVYRPQVLPNPYMFSSHPVIPTMPGPYHTPVPYDGYYGYQQASFCSSGEQHMPSGVAIQPSVYKQSPNSSGNITSDEFPNSLGGDVTQKVEVQVPSDRAHAPFPGPYKVLLKPQGDLAYKVTQAKTHSGSSSPTSTQSHVESKPEASISKESEQSAGSRKNEIANDMNLVSDHRASLKVAGDGMCQLSNPIISNLEVNSNRTSEGILKRGPNISIQPVYDWKPNSVTRKNVALIEKIEGLNNKVRSAENHSIVGGLSSKQERLKQPKVANARTGHFTKARGIAIPSSFEGYSLDTHTIDSTVVSGQSDSMDFIPIESGSCVSKGAPSAIGRGDYSSNSRLDNQTDGELTRESSEKGAFVVPMEKIVTEDAYSDSLDHKDQRAKMKELAAQRAKQLQKQEEERTREQKAKALAKLEELNKRSAALSMKPKSNEVSSLSHNPQQQEDPGADIASNVTLSAVDMPLQANEYNKVGPVVSLPCDYVSQTPETVAQDSRSGSIPTLSMEHHTNTTEVVAHEGSQFNASSGSKHRPVGNRRRQKVPQEKNPGEKSAMRENTGSKFLDEIAHESKSDEMHFISEKNQNSQKLVEVNAPASSVDILPHNGDPSLQQKKKNHRNVKNRNKDDTLFGSSTSTHSNEKIEEYPSESSRLNPAPPVLETSSVPALISSDHGSGQECGDGIVHSRQGSSKVVDEGQGRMNNHRKPQPSRKMARNHQAIKPTDKVHGSETVIWAPVRPANKIEQLEEIKQNSIIGNFSDSSLQIGNDISGTKTKRAEIERYVPKPVAKEHLQQYTQKSTTHLSQLTSDEMPEKPYLDSKFGPGKFDGSSEFGADTKKTEDNKPGRRGRVQASWRQRNSADTVLPSQASNENVQPSDATETFDKPSNQHLPLPEQVRSDGWEGGDSLVQKNSDVAPIQTKDQGIRSMQKHQQAHRVTGSNYGTDDHNSKNNTNEKNGVNPLNLDTSENDVKIFINDNGKNVVGDHVRSHSHWKPKSQIQQGRGTGGQRNFYHDARPEKFGYPGAGSNHPSNETSNTLNRKDQSRNSASSVEQMHSRRPVVDMSPQRENQVSPPHQYGQRNGRVNRGQEATYRGRDFMHTSGKSNAQRIEDQHKNTPHFEYQPVDSHSKPSNAYRQPNSSIDQEAQGHHASRQKYKERYHTQTRNPGRFIRSATSHVDDSHNGEE